MNKQKVLAMGVLIVLSILLNGCGPLKYEAGSTHHFSEKIAFYLAPTVTEEELAPLRQSNPKINDDDLTQIIAWSRGKYLPMTDEIPNSLAENTEWRVSEGFALSNAKVSVEPAELIWKITEGNYENTYKLVGFVGVFEADITMPSSGEGKLNCEVTLGNFGLLNMVGALIGQKLPLFESSTGPINFRNTDNQRYYPSPVVIDGCGVNYRIKP